MSLRLIYGRAGTGKSRQCMEEIKKELEQGGDHPLILLIPEQFSLQAEKNLVDIVGPGIMRAEVLSFRRMAYRVFNEVGGVANPHINSAGKSMLLYNTIDKIKDQLKIFSKTVNQQGFINTILETITEFKRYNITPHNLYKAHGDMEEEGLFKDKLGDMALIFDSFEQNLHINYIDSEDDLTLLADKLENSLKLRGAEIWIDEFFGFTPQEYRVIEKLLYKAKRVNVSLCTQAFDTAEVVDQSDVFWSTKRCCQRLLKLARSNNIAIDPPLILGSNDPIRFKNSQELCHLEQNFFSFPYNRYQYSTKDISLFSASNIYSEIEDTARDILRLCREEDGIRYRDIGVVVRDLASYQRLVEVIFNQYRIPCFIDVKKPITSHPIVMLILSVFDILTRNWSYEGVFRYLKTGLTNVKREDIDIIENYVLARGIRGSQWTKEEQWQNKDDEQLMETIDNIRKEITAPILSFYEGIRKNKKPKEICGALYQFLCDIDLPDRIEGLIQGFKDSGQLDQAKEYSQIWNIIMDVLDQTVEVMGDTDITLEHFEKILSLGFGEYKMGIIPPAQDQVMVGSIDRSKSHAIKALYIIGVNDGVFPAASSKEGILLDVERERLLSLGVEIAPTTKARAFEEKYLIYKSLTVPSNYLRISYPIADGEGKTLRQSIIISRLKKIFPQITQFSNIVKSGKEEELQTIANGEASFNELLARLRGHREGKEISPLWWDVYRWYCNQQEWKEKIQGGISALFYTNQTKAITGDRAKQLYGSPVRSSVSKLEKYVSCPFSYFVQYGLGVKERKIYQLSSPDLGTFFHQVIDQFSNHLSTNNILWRDLERQRCEEIISDIVDELIKSMSMSIMVSSPRYQYLTSRLKRVLARAVWIIAQHIKKSGFEPLDYELGFGDGQKLPPITVELSSGEVVKLEGRIDRIDTMKTEEGTYLRIIDYKSGNKAFKLSDAYYGLQIQLISYLDALVDNGSEVIGEKLIPGGMLYFKIDDPIIRGGNIQSEEDIERSIIKQLKMKGLLLADAKVIKEMDREIDGDSIIIPARINKDGKLGRSSAATIEQFELLRKHTKNLLAKLSEEMLRGNISISPYKKKSFVSCGFCSYSSICQFDTSFRDNSYRTIEDKKDDAVWELINKTNGQGGGE